MFFSWLSISWNMSSKIDPFPSEIIHFMNQMCCFMGIDLLSFFILVIGSHTLLHNNGIMIILKLLEKLKGQSEFKFNFFGSFGIKDENVVELI